MSNKLQKEVLIRVKLEKFKQNVKKTVRDFKAQYLFLKFKIISFIFLLYFVKQITAKNIQLSEL